MSRVAANFDATTTVLSIQCVHDPLTRPWNTGIGDMYPRAIVCAGDYVYIGGYDSHKIYRTDAYEFKELEIVAGNGETSGRQTGPALSCSTPRPTTLFLGLHGSIHITSFLNEEIIELKNGTLASLPPVYPKDKLHSPYQFYMVRGGFVDPKSGTMYVSEFGHDLIQEITLDRQATAIGDGKERHADGDYEHCSFHGATQVIAGEPGFILASERRAVRLIDLERRYVSTYAGSGATGHVDGPRLLARFSFIRSLNYRDGSIFLSDESPASIRMIDRHGMVSTLHLLGSTDDPSNLAGSLCFTPAGHIAFTSPAKNKIAMLRCITEPDQIRRLRKAPYSLVKLDSLCSSNPSSSSHSSENANQGAKSEAERNILAIGTHLRLFAPFVRLAYPNLFVCDHAPILAFCSSTLHCDMLSSLIYAQEIDLKAPRASLVALHECLAALGTTVFPDILLALVAQALENSLEEAMEVDQKQVMSTSTNDKAREMVIPPLKHHSYVRHVIESLYIRCGSLGSPEQYQAQDIGLDIVDVREFGALENFQNFPVLSHLALHKATSLLGGDSTPSTKDISASAIQALTSAEKDMEPNFSLVCKKDGSAVRVHDWVLVARWPYFELLQQMSDNTLEWQQRTLEFPEDTFSETTIRALVQYFYTNVPSGFHSPHTALELLQNASQFYITDLSTPAIPKPGFELLVEHCRLVAFPYDLLSQPSLSTPQLRDDCRQFGSQEQIDILTNFDRAAMQAMGYYQGIPTLGSDEMMGGVCRASSISIALSQVPGSKTDLLQVNVA